MIVPFIDLNPVAALVRERVFESFRRVVDHTEFVGGPSVAALEATLARKLGVQHAVTCASGSDALVIALAAVGIGPGKRVAVPNLTFWATFEAIAHLGAVPVLVDVDPNTLQVDFDQLVQAHESVGLDGAVLVHLMGWASPRLDDFRTFCSGNGIALVEDGAQAYGVRVHGRSVFTGARVGTLSFYPAKVVGGCMNGGALLTDDPELASTLRRLCNHGRATHYTYSQVGWNSRIGGLQAAWLLELLEHDQVLLARRKEIEASYQVLFASMGDPVQAFGPPDGVTGNGYLSVCTVERRALGEVTAELAAAGISIGQVYPETMDMQPPAHGAIRVGDLTNAREFCKTVVNLPLFYGMTDEQVDYVADVFGRVASGPRLSSKAPRGCG